MRIPRRAGPSLARAVTDPALPLPAREDPAPRRQVRFMIWPGGAQAPQLRTGPLSICTKSERE